MHQANRLSEVRAFVTPFYRGGDGGSQGWKGVRPRAPGTERQGPQPTCGHRSLSAEEAARAAPQWLCSYRRHIIPPLPRQRGLSWAALGQTQADLDVQGDTPASQGCRLSCERGAVVIRVLGAPSSNQPVTSSRGAPLVPPVSGACCLLESLERKARDVPS